LQISLTLPAMPQARSKTTAPTADDAAKNIAEQARAEEKAREEAAANKAEESEPKYTVEELIEAARGWLDCSPVAAAGALSGTQKKSFTIDEAKQMVSDFLEYEHEEPA
jgi:phage protein D